MNTVRLDGKKRVDIQAAAAMVQAGGLVAFPTETVYGLGADMYNKKAVRAVFKTKGRPQDNPLIVHVANKREVRQIAQHISTDAKMLMDHFWPGPLTLVLEKQDIVPDNVTAGLPTVCVRMPLHPTALFLIRAAKTPLVAPSANLSGKPSPTTADHVFDDFHGKIAGIIDGGSCDVGIESTVVDCTGNIPRIMRPGVITAQEISEVLGKKIPRWRETDATTDSAPRSPGMKYAHYAPNARVELYTDEKQAMHGFARGAEKGGTVWYLSTKPPAKSAAAYLRWKPLLNQTLYAHFRDADKQEIQTIIIYADFPTQKNLGLINRMRKAADFSLL